ncbi:MAG: hypothetical protein SFU86_25800 [Pirellulaceae bacterium]|nr:hypothetical protein [Pirellulaceae bacterium]
MSKLAWRIPTGPPGPSLRLGIAQIALATVVAALVLVVAAPRAWLGPALIGLAPLAVFVAYRKWLAHQQGVAGPDNVWIDETGVHWLDDASGEQLFARAQVLGFRIGPDPDTLREVPALTLHLAGGFRSQPIELHPPAKPDQVRLVLAGEWGLHESSVPDDPGKLQYDVAVDVYSECHDDYQEWHIEGSAAALRELFAAIAQAARDLPLAPTGARPARRVVLCRRRHPLELRVARLPAPFCGDDRLGGPAEWLADLCRSAEEALAPLKTGDDGKFNLVVGPHDTWTWHLHIRD